MTELRRRRGGGPELLAYREGRRWRDVSSSDINEFVKKVVGGEVSAKDFRTWHGTVLAAVALAETADSGTCGWHAARPCGAAMSGRRVSRQHTDDRPDVVHRSATDRPLRSRRNDRPDCTAQVEVLGSVPKRRSCACSTSDLHIAWGPAQSSSGSISTWAASRSISSLQPVARPRRVTLSAPAAAPRRSPSTSRHRRRGLRRPRRQRVAGSAMILGGELWRSTTNRAWSMRATAGSAARVVTTCRHPRRRGSASRRRRQPGRRCRCALRRSAPPR